MDTTFVLITADCFCSQLSQVRIGPADSNSAFSNSPLFGAQKPFAMDFPVIVHLPWAISNTRYFEVPYLFSPRIRNRGVELNVELGSAQS